MTKIKLPPTVFEKLSPTASSAEHIMALSNRKAVVIYALYFVWGILTAIASIPTIANATSDNTQLLFSLIIAATCLPAALGALFFPRTGRLELFAGSAFITLMCVYLYFIFSDVFIDENPLGRLASFILILSVLIMPIGRGLFIFKQLIRKGTKSNE